MACLNTLKLEIKTLEQIFTKNHERFRILNASVDELSCRFIGRNGKQYDIHANITVSALNLGFVLFFILLGCTLMVVPGLGAGGTCWCRCYLLGEYFILLNKV